MRCPSCNSVVNSSSIRCSHCGFFAPGSIYFIDDMAFAKWKSKRNSRCVSSSDEEFHNIIGRILDNPDSYSKMQLYEALNELSNRYFSSKSNDEKPIKVISDYSAASQKGTIQQLNHKIEANESNNDRPFSVARLWGLFIIVSTIIAIIIFLIASGFHV